AGTERAASDFARKSLLGKAKSRPDLAREVFGKARRDGIMATLAAVRTRLEEPNLLGYSSAGTVVRVGEGVTDLTPGDRVACAGAGYAVHAEFACVPRLLLAKVPSPQISFEAAAFTTMGAIALHAVRTAEVGVGDVVAVIGLGLLGQLTLQILKAAGCQVIGTDLLSERLELARASGIDGATSSVSDFCDLCFSHTAGRGADAVLIAAQSSGNDLVNVAAEVSRERGMVVVVGAVGMHLERKLFYEKELELRVSRSYGPGRYDSAFERKGIDYPAAYVRWTETRNMEAFLELLGARKVQPEALITHRFPVAQAHQAYELISGKTAAPFLGALLTYPLATQESPLAFPGSARGSGQRTPAVSVGLIGAGSFARSTLLPAMKRCAQMEFVGVASARGASCHRVAQQFGFRYCATNGQEVIRDPAVNTVVIATRHHLHAAEVLGALEYGKHVFCEKPLCVREDELSAIVRAYQARSDRRPLLMVGFNRRFAPLSVRLRAFLKSVHQPLVLHYRVNAGPVAQDHWIHDPHEGGGRLLGEVCHFIDFFGFLLGSPPLTIEARALASGRQGTGDDLILTLDFPDGSQGTITYVASGDKSYSKERLEVFGGGAVAVLEDFRRLELVRRGHRRVFRHLLRQDKGHVHEWKAFSSAVLTGKPAPISFEEIIGSTVATLRAAESLARGGRMAMGLADLIEPVEK
ncbi:MAG: bi-domain-containing oxidoreductase, partial [Deltaproteobacteria bacterium]|nr:bi-domain-containing oxidoreductase [Deltaproteobacteria bacterium]